MPLFGAAIFCRASSAGPRKLQSVRRGRPGIGIRLAHSLGDLVPISCCGRRTQSSILLFPIFPAPRNPWMKTPVKGHAKEVKTKTLELKTPTSHLLRMIGLPRSGRFPTNSSVSSDQFGIPRGTPMIFPSNVASYGSPVWRVSNRAPLSGSKYFNLRRAKLGRSSP